MWTLEHWVFAYNTYVQTNMPIVNTQRPFRQHFSIEGHGNFPTLIIIFRWVHSFQIRRTVMNMRPLDLRRKTGKYQEGMVGNVKEPISFCTSSCYWIGIERLNGKAYFTQWFRATSLQNSNRAKVKCWRLRIKSCFSENMLAISADNDNVIIMMSDEAHSHLNGVVNK